MNNCLHWDVTAADADGGKTAPAAWAGVVRHMIVVMLLTAAALDLTRCGLVMTAARHPAPTAGLVAAGLATTALTARTAHGCRAGRRWAGWAALLIGAASAPQAAVSGFRSPYLIPDTATAALGVLLAITILATADRMDCLDMTPKILPSWTGEPLADQQLGRPDAGLPPRRPAHPAPHDEICCPGRPGDQRHPPLHHAPMTSQETTSYITHHLKLAPAAPAPCSATTPPPSSTPPPAATTIVFDDDLDNSSTPTAGTVSGAS